MKSLIPIYVNLKELTREKDQRIDGTFIGSFVLRILNRTNQRDIEQFLEKEFHRSLQEATWLFLFDSFDEIPEILSATEADAAVKAYADAIFDFLHGFNQCRGVIASRHFRGPRLFGWPRFRILEMTTPRQWELIRKTDLEPNQQRQLIGHLGAAGSDLSAMAANPMFLGLLCEYVRSGNPFPDRSHTVFENYVTSRLIRDKERIAKRFSLSDSSVREAAEEIAFCMAADPGLGLSPRRDDIKEAMKRQGFTPGNHFEPSLDALEYIKLARLETEAQPTHTKSFTFAHRRFQEYFATCMVLQDIARVKPRLLLTDARWRETAVTMCQTQPVELLKPLLQEAESLLNEALSTFMQDTTLVDETLEIVKRAAAGGQGHLRLPNSYQHATAFPWPPGVLHVLGILQEGLRTKDVPDALRTKVGAFLCVASATGLLSDRKSAMEVAGIATPDVMLMLLRTAIAGKSQWLKDMAFRQVARLSPLPLDIADWIRESLVNMALSRRLYRERHATSAHLARLEEANELIPVMNLLLYIPVLDTLLLVFVAGVSLVFQRSPGVIGGLATLLVLNQAFSPLLVA